MNERLLYDGSASVEINNHHRQTLYKVGKVMIKNGFLWIVQEGMITGSPMNQVTRLQVEDKFIEGIE